MLLNKEFDLLLAILENNTTNQRDLSIITNQSLGSTNRYLSLLREKKLINTDGSITDYGKAELNEYKVDNAIILAAGVSSRFIPISYNLPKALITINGEILIERLIRQLNGKGINDITIVVGHQRELFFYLEEKFNVNLVYSPNFQETNSFHSLYHAKNKLRNTLIFPSDVYLNKNIISQYFYQPFHTAIFNKGYSNKWSIKIGHKNRINGYKIGNKDCFLMQGFAYFDKHFSNKYLAFSENEIKDELSKSLHYEDVIFRHLKDLEFYAKIYTEGDFFEFDSIDELRKFDEVFIKKTESKIINNIINYFNCDKDDITDFRNIDKGLNNSSFYFKVKESEYIYRQPGIGTNETINRYNEFQAIQYAKELGLDDTCLIMDPVEGYKISTFIPGVIDYNPFDFELNKQAFALLKKLHNAKIDVDYEFDMWKESEKLLKLTEENSGIIFQDFYNIRERNALLQKYIESYGEKRVLCHNDFYDPNIMYDGKKLYLIDWEFAGKNYPAVDFGTFLCCSYTEQKDVDKAIEIFLERKPTKREYIYYLAGSSISSYYWLVWALYKESLGDSVGEWLYIWYRFTRDYSKLAIKTLNNNE